MVKVLELFSGTGSVGKCCKQLGWETVSVDLISESTHKCDIMDFDYKQYPKDSFDIVWLLLLALTIVNFKTVG